MSKHLTTKHRSAPAGAVVPLAPLSAGELAVEPFINKKEVARRLGWSTRGVDNMMQRREIPYYKFGRRCAYRWSEILQHLAETCRVIKS